MQVSDTVVAPRILVSSPDDDTYTIEIERRKTHSDIFWMLQRRRSYRSFTSFTFIWGKTGSCTSSLAEMKSQQLTPSRVSVQDITLPRGGGDWPLPAVSLSPQTRPKWELCPFTSVGQGTIVVQFVTEEKHIISFIFIFFEELAREIYIANKGQKWNLF